MMKEAGIKSLADFDAYLRLQGTSLRKLRLHWSKDQLTRYFMSQELEFDKEVSHRELLEEYQKNRASYAIPAKARWEQITVRFDKTASREEAERMLVEMGNKIVYGANFASVAKKGSHGFTASNGGLHDWIGKNELASKELDKAIFSEEIGKLSDKIETAEGLHIIRVLDRTEDSYTPFVDAQVKIKEELLNKKRAEVFEKHLAELRQEIPVVRYDQEEPSSVRVAEKLSR
jgi:parvulin-like peptidyl-prolyl isomerase